MILIVDFGSQYTQLIARRVRELGVYCEIKPWYNTFENLNDIEGVILSGGPNSVYEKNSAILHENVLKLNMPIFGICYGAQLLIHHFGGRVLPAKKREFGLANITIKNQSELFKNIPYNQVHSVWMSHGDLIESIPSEFQAIAQSDSSPYAAVENKSNNYFGVQFHPEVTHTQIGKQMIHNFVLSVCKSNPNWTMKNYIQLQHQNIRAMVKDEHVLSTISGGVDSAVSTVLLHEALGDQVTAIFVDHGLLRKNEREQVEKNIKQAFGVKLIVVDASNEFFESLKGVEDPELKRKIIGNKFIDVFERESKKIKDATFLGQGTIYPDVIESSSHHGPSVTIKSHHNVGGLPKDMKLKLVEPLRSLFKDEVRLLGQELGLSSTFLNRHPFPGPGMAVRILGEVTKERVRLLQDADQIFIDELYAFKQYDNVWQAFAVLLPVKSVGVMGDLRTYENVLALRAVSSVDGMTASSSRLPYELLEKVSNRIINEVKGINRVVYDVSSKPPATIEWE